MREGACEMDTRFHCVYLLTSLDPQCEGDYYIGYTVDPIRRLRQHNGELVNGAWRTKRRGRPWELICCVSGFGEDRVALKFEWCWQHPSKSSRLKSLVSQLRGVHRLPFAVGVLHLLLRADLFARLPLTLHLFESDRFARAAAFVRERALGFEPLVSTPLLRMEETTREAFQQRYISDEGDPNACTGENGGAVYFITANGTPSQPNANQTQAQTQAQPSPSFPVASGRGCKFLSEEDLLRAHAREKALLDLGLFPCALCALPLRPPFFLRCARAPYCGLRAHLVCLAMWFTQHSLTGPKQTPEAEGASNTGGATRTLAALVPRVPCGCPLCAEPLRWATLVYDLKRRATTERRWAQKRRQEKLETVWRERLQRIRAAGKKPKASPRSRRLGVGTKRRRDASTPEGSGGMSAATASASMRLHSGNEPVEHVAAATGGDAEMAKVLPLTEFNEEEWLNF